MNYNQTIPTPTGLEQWQDHVHELEVLNDDKGHIVIRLSEMGVAIVNYLLTPKMRDHIVKLLMQA